MDLSSLETLGKVAGLGGIAIGVVALLVRSLFDRVSSVHLRRSAHRYSASSLLGL